MLEITSVMHINGNFLFYNVQFILSVIDLHFHYFKHAMKIESESFMNLLLKLLIKYLFFTQK